MKRHGTYGGAYRVHHCPGLGRYYDEPPGRLFHAGRGRTGRKGRSGTCYGQDFQHPQAGLSQMRAERPGNENGAYSLRGLLTPYVGGLTGKKKKHFAMIAVGNHCKVHFKKRPCGFSLFCHAALAFPPVWSYNVSTETYCGRPGRCRYHPPALYE